MPKKLQNYITKIGSLHGVKVLFRKSISGGGYCPRTHVIYLEQGLSSKELITIFCHELGHHKNNLEGVHAMYHQEISSKAIRRVGLVIYVNAALSAEIYTEKVGKKIAKDWFPGHKYIASYKDTAYWRGFLTGYYVN